MTDPLKTQVGGDHYKSSKIQPVEYAHANKLDFFQGSIVKYITRFREKNGKEDLEKIKHYVDLLIKLEYGDEPAKPEQVTKHPDWPAGARGEPETVKRDYLAADKNSLISQVVGNEVLHEIWATPSQDRAFQVRRECASKIDVKLGVVLLPDAKHYAIRT